MRKLKLYKREVIKSDWVYESVVVGFANVKKGDTTLNIEPENMFDNDGELYRCLKVNETIYDIKEYKDGIVTLTEEITGDFEGCVYHEASLPLIIRTKSDLTVLKLEQENNFKKLKSVEKTLDMYAPKKKAIYMNKLAEAGKIDIVPQQVIMITIDEAENEKQDVAQNEIRKYLELALHIDMDYEFEDKTTLWDVMGVKKGNYVEVTKLLMALGIFGNDEEYYDFKFTIDALVAKEKNIKEFVEAKKKEANMLILLQELRDKMPKEEFEAFMAGLVKSQDEQLQP